MGRKKFAAIRRTPDPTPDPIPLVIYERDDPAPDETPAPNDDQSTLPRQRKTRCHRPSPARRRTRRTTVLR